MKNTILCILSFLILTINGQTEDAKWNIGLHGGFTQYTGDLGQGWYSTDQAAYSFAGISVSRYMNRYFDVGISGTLGEVGYMAPRDYSLDPDIRTHFLVSLTTVNPFLRYHFTSREAVFGPYLFAGPSIIRQRRLTDNFTNRGWEIAAPTAGAGINIRMGPIVSFQLQEMFLYQWKDDIDYTVAGGWNDMYVFHTIGLTFNIPKRQKGMNKPSGDIDKCPKIKTGTERKDGEGKAKLNGEKKKGLFKNRKK